MKPIQIADRKIDILCGVINKHLVCFSNLGVSLYLEYKMNCEKKIRYFNLRKTYK